MRCHFGLETRKCGLAVEPILESPQSPTVNIRLVVTYLQFPIQICFPCSVCFRHRHIRHRHIPELISDVHSSRMCTWLGSLVVRAFHSPLDGLEFDSWPPQLLLGWLTVFGPANHLSVLQVTQANSASYPQLDEKRVPAKLQ